MSFSFLRTIISLPPSCRQLTINQSLNLIDLSLSRKRGTQVSVLSIEIIFIYLVDDISSLTCSGRTTKQKEVLILNALANKIIIPYGVYGRHYYLVEFPTFTYKISVNCLGPIKPHTFFRNEYHLKNIIFSGILWTIAKGLNGYRRQSSVLYILGISAFIVTRCRIQSENVFLEYSSIAAPMLQIVLNKII